VAVLLVVFESEVFVSVAEKLAVAHNAAGSGVTGILIVSLQSDAMFVVFVHVTCLLAFMALHDHPLSENVVEGPVKLAAIVNTTVWIPFEATFPAFDIITGMSDG
jgi:hypothetical protein